jgi:hypothetical protein
MVITPWLVSNYLYDVTDIWAANDPMPPESVEDYAGLIRKAGRRAEERGELDALRRGIEYILGHPEIDAGPLVAQVFPYEDEGARELLRYVRELLWHESDPVPAGSTADVQWQTIPLPEWRRQYHGK